MAVKVETGHGVGFHSSDLVEVVAQVVGAGADEATRERAILVSLAFLADYPLSDLEKTPERRLLNAWLAAPAEDRAKFAPFLRRAAKVGQVTSGLCAAALDHPEPGRCAGAFVQSVSSLLGGVTGGSSTGSFCAGFREKVRRSEAEGWRAQRQRVRGATFDTSGRRFGGVRFTNEASDGDLTDFLLDVVGDGPDARERAVRAGYVGIKLLLDGSELRSDPGRPAVEAWLVAKPEDRGRHLPDARAAYPGTCNPLELLCGAIVGAEPGRAAAGALVRAAQGRVPAGAGHLSGVASGADHFINRYRTALEAAGLLHARVA